MPKDAAGLSWPPTVLTNVDASMRVMNEEVFGPILPIQIEEDDEEAIAEANRSAAGLDAYVFCDNPERAERIANRLEAGTVDINEAVVNYVIAALPFGGIKQAGLNRYHGKVGLRLFSNMKSMVTGDGKLDTGRLRLGLSAGARLRTKLNRQEVFECPSGVCATGLRGCARTEDWGNLLRRDSHDVD